MEEYTWGYRKTDGKSWYWDGRWKGQGRETGSTQSIGTQDSPRSDDYWSVVKSGDYGVSQTGNQNNEFPLDHSFTTVRKKTSLITHHNMTLPLCVSVTSFKSPSLLQWKPVQYTHVYAM